MGDTSDTSPVTTTKPKRRRIGVAELRRLAAAYVREGSAYRAALAIGWPESRARARAAALIRDSAVVQQAIADIREREAAAAAASRSEVIAALSAVIRADPLPLLRGDPPDTWPEDLRRSIQSIRAGADGPSVQLADRVSAARVLGQAQGWLGADLSVGVMVGLSDRLAAARARVRDGSADAGAADARLPDQTPDTATAGD